MALGGGGGAGGSGAIRAGRAFVEFFLKDNQFFAGLRRLQAGLEAAGKYVALFGGGLVGIGTSVASPLLGLFKSAVDRGSAFSNLSAKFGDSAENLSALAYAAETTGVNLEELGGDLEAWSERLAEAARGEGKAVEALRLLGLGAGQLAAIKQLPLTEQVLALSGAMAGVTNDADRLMFLSKTLGGSGGNLNELLKKGPAGIRALMAEAAAVGAVTTTERAQEAERAQQALNRAWAAGRSALLAFGAALLPLVGDLEKASAWAVSVAKSVRLFAEENKAAVQTALLVAAATVAAGLAFVALGVTIASVGAAIGAVMTAAYAAGQAVLAVGALLTSPWGLALVSAASLAAMFLTLTGAGEQLGDAIRDHATAALGTFSETWGGVKSALASGDLALAGKVALAGLAVEFERAKGDLEKAWGGFTAAFAHNWRTATTQAKLDFNDLVNAIAKGGVSATEELNKFGRAMADSIALDEVADANDRWAGFWAGFVRDATAALAGVERALRAIFSRISLVLEGLLYTTGGFVTGTHEPLQAFRRRFESLPPVIEKVGEVAAGASEAVAGINSEILRGADAAMRNGTGAKTAGLIGDLERIRKRNEDDIISAKIASDGEAIDAGKKALEARRAALQAAQDELDVLIGIAEENAIPKMPEAPPGGGGKPNPAALLASGLTRGTFGVPNFNQFFGGGPLSVAQKQLEEGKRQTNRLGEIFDVLKKIDHGIQDNAPRFA